MKKGSHSNASIPFFRPSGRVVSESEVSAADFLINSVGQNTCKLYTDAILKIPEITTSMITQLTTDIGRLILCIGLVVPCQPQRQCLVFHDNTEY